MPFLSKGEESEMPPATIIVITRNNQHYLEDCINSLLQTAYTDYEIVIVNNGSEDGTGEYVRKVQRRHPNIILLENSSNIGHAAAFNQGVDLARNELVAKLDDDTIVERDWLTRLVKVMTSDPAIAAVQAGAYKYDDPLTRYLGGGGDIDVLGRIHFRPVKEVAEVFFPVMFALITRKSLFKKVGGLYADYFIYYDEVDLAWRFRLAGFKIYVAPDAIVRHRGPSKVNGSHPVVGLFHAYKNNLHSVLVNYSLWNAWRYSLVLCSLIAISGLRGLVLRRRFDELLTAVGAIAWNLRNMRGVVQRRRNVRSLRKLSDSQLMLSMCKLGLRQ